MSSFKDRVSTACTELGIISSKFVRCFYAYNIDPASGTFNSVVCASTSTTSILNSRHLFKTFDKTTEEAVSVSTAITRAYTDGANIKVILTTTENTAASNVRWVVGLTKETTGGAFSDDTDAEYIASTVATSAGWDSHKTTFTFNGSSLVKGETINIIVYRDTTHIDDDLNGDAYLNKILIEEV